MLTENTRTYLITCHDEDDRLVVSHGVNDYDGRNVCLPCESLSHFFPRFYCRDAGEWFLPYHSIKTNTALRTAIFEDHESVSCMAEKLNLNMFRNVFVDGYLCFMNSESLNTFNIVYGDYV